MLSGEDIKFLRERLDLRQREFGALIGLSHAHEKRGVAMYERGDSTPCWKVLRHLRTLTAVANAICALQLGKPALASELLEEIFIGNGAVPIDDEKIATMKVRNANN